MFYGKVRFGVGEDTGCFAEMASFLPGRGGECGEGTPGKADKNDEVANQELPWM